MTAMYLICGRNPDGESLDLTVEANDAGQAEAIWRDWVENDFGSEVDDKDFAIYSLPALTGTPQAMLWGLNVICLKDTRR